MNAVIRQFYTYFENGGGGMLQMKGVGKAYQTYVIITWHEISLSNAEKID